MPPPMAFGQLPVFKNFLKWFSGEELIIDNFLFRVHHRFTTAVLMFGLMFVFLENHLDGRAINCQGADNYARSYCWIHGTGYLKQHLQGEATGCFVDQSSIPENQWEARVTAYYLWIPFLLTFCIGFSKVPRVVWKNGLEGKLMLNIIQDRNTEASVIAENFVELRKRFPKYQMQFAFCELLNILMVFLNMFICDMLFLNKFWTYGTEVWDYLRAFQPYGQRLHDPMCELFPTEVACYITIGASTGGKDQNNYLCILSNNLFNQKYFLVVWLWWVCLIVVSVLGLIYRVARISMPDLSRKLVVRKVKSHQVENLRMSGPEYFMLDRLSDTLDHHKFRAVVDEVAKKLNPDFIPLANGNALHVPEYIRKEMQQPPFYKKPTGSSGSESTTIDF